MSQQSINDCLFSAVPYQMASKNALGMLKIAHKNALCILKIAQKNALGILKIAHKNALGMLKTPCSRTHRQQEEQNAGAPLVWR